MSFVATPLEGKKRKATGEKEKETLPDVEDSEYVCIKIDGGKI